MANFNLESQVRHNVNRGVVVGNFADARLAVRGPSIHCPRHLLPIGTRTKLERSVTRMRSDQRSAMQALWAGRSTATAGVLAGLARFARPTILFGWPSSSETYRYATGWHTPPTIAKRYAAEIASEDKRRVAK